MSFRDTIRDRRNWGWHHEGGVDVFLDFAEAWFNTHPTLRSVATAEVEKLPHGDFWKYFRWTSNDPVEFAEQMHRVDRVSVFWQMHVDRLQQLASKAAADDGLKYLGRIQQVIARNKTRKAKAEIGRTRYGYEPIPDDVMQILESHMPDAQTRKSLRAAKKAAEWRAAAALIQKQQEEEKRRQDEEAEKRKAWDERQEAIRKERETIEAARREQQKRRRPFIHLQKRIADRCRRIVTVFNGVFGLEIDPDAVLAGNVTGTFAALAHGGIGMELLAEQRMEMQMLQVIDHSWIEIEEGMDQPEMRATFISTNFLVWHELAHLAPSRVVHACLHRRDASNDVRVQERETVIDGIALLLGHNVFAHPPSKTHLVRPLERRALMLKSHGILVRRVHRKFVGSDVELEQQVLARLLAEVEVHREKGWHEDRRVEEVLRGSLSDAAKDALAIYKTAYVRALKLNVLALPFLNVPDEEHETETESFRGISFAD